MVRKRTQPSPQTYLAQTRIWKTTQKCGLRVSWLQNGGIISFLSLPGKRLVRMSMVIIIWCLNQMPTAVQTQTKIIEIKRGRHVQMTRQLIFIIGSQSATAHTTKIYKTWAGWSKVISSRISGAPLQSAHQPLSRSLEIITKPNLLMPLHEMCKPVWTSSPKPYG